VDAVLQFVPLLIVLLLVGWACWFAFVRPTLPSKPLVGTGPLKPLTGIGGWLGLIAIGQALLPLVLVGQLIVYEVENQRLWKTHPVLLGGEAVLNIGMVLFAIWCSINFFKKRKAFPQLFIWELWLIVFMPFADGLWVSVITDAPLDDLVNADDTKTTLRALINAIVWTLYTVKSVRVKNTFVN
jgi:hypothetical protein